MATDLGGVVLAHPQGRPWNTLERALLVHVGALVDPSDVCRTDEPPDPVAAWARSGALWCTRDEDGTPVLPPGDGAARADAAATVLRALTAASGHEVAVDGAALLGERAAIAGLVGRGRGSAGGACRLVELADGWCAVSLPRPEDRAMVPAWLETTVDVSRAGVWTDLARVLRHRHVDDVTARARLLGLAVAAVREPVDAAADEQAVARGQSFPFTPWLAQPRSHRASRARSLVGLTVLDCSALWAGPLCAHLLARAGCEVVKLEDPRRPDGARAGPPEFYDLLNARKRSVALELDSERARRTLRRLAERVDVVIESSRPRAFEALGVDYATILEANPDVTWCSITGWGHRGPSRNCAGFGDDTAVGGGLVAWGRDGPVFVGDAIADPLAGLHAAVAVVAGAIGGGGVHLDVALREVAGSTLARCPTLAPSPTATSDDTGGWWFETDSGPTPVLAPSARRAERRARALGADTDAVLADLLH